MGDATLHGVLNMPANLWNDTELDKQQRHSRYVQASQRIIELEKANRALVAGIAAVEALMDNSEGVAGLHLNGQVAEWSTLQTDGNLQQWLIEFDQASDAVKAMKSQTIEQGESGADKKYASVVVVCRQIGDDEDSLSIHDDCTTDDAIAESRADVVVDEDTSSNEDVFLLNAVLVSDSPITGSITY